MTSQELAQHIRDHFTPFAFTCACEGKHNDCYEAKNSPSLQAQYDTVQRIAKYIERLGK